MNNCDDSGFLFSASRRVSRLIAHRGSFRVRSGAGCGRVLVVEIGPLALRFDRDALRQFHRTLGDALSSLERDREDTALSLGLTFSGPTGEA